MCGRWSHEHGWSRTPPPFYWCVGRKMHHLFPSFCGVLWSVSEPPTIELDFRDKIIIRVGESCLLQGRYTGKPPPSIAWYRDEEEVKADKHVLFKNTVTTMSLGLMKAQRQHSGRYVVVVENSTGSRKGVCNVTVVGEWPLASSEMTSLTRTCDQTVP